MSENGGELVDSSSPPNQNNEEKAMEVIHFKSPKERMDYVKGNFEEIIPIKAKEEPKKADEKPKKAKKSAKKSEKEDKNGKV